MIQRLKIKPIGYLILAFIFPLILVGLAYLAVDLTPFGDHNLLISDIGTQYIPFFTEFRRQILSHNFNFYWFSLSLGDNAFTLISYYLLSPFNILVLFGSAAQVPIAVAIIIWLKITAAGLTMAIFLRVLTKKWNLTALLFSTAYSLCGFVAMYFYDLMWLDGVILLPVVAWGLLRLVQTRHGGLYTIALFLTIVTNYYLGYMTCLFAVFYFIYLLTLKKHEKNTRHFWQGEKSLIWQFLITSGISGLMTSVVLLPTIIGMLKTGKQAINVQAYLPSLAFGPEVLTQLGVVGVDINQHLQHAPSIFMGTLAGMGLLIYFVGKEIPNWRKKAGAFFLGSLVLSMWVTTFNTIWHMFQKPNGFPFRNVYFFTFVAIVFAYQALEENKLDVTKVKRVTLMWDLLLIVGYASAFLVEPFWQRAYPGIQLYTSFTNLFLALVISWLLAGGLYLRLHKPTRYLGWIMIVLVVGGELTYNFYGSFAPAQTGSQKDYARDYDTENRWLKKTRPKDLAFYRVNNQNSLINQAYKEPYNNYNDPLLFNLNGINLYSSTLNENTRQALVQLGFYSKNARRIGSTGSTVVTDTLFDIKYILNMTPADYELSENPDSTLGIGFAVSSQVKNVYLNPQDPIGNQQHLLNGMLNNQRQYFRPATLEKQTIKQVKSDTYHYTLKLKTQTDGPLYTYLPDVVVASSNLYVNGKKHQTHLYLSNDAILYLGHFDKGTEITITLTVPSLRYDLAHDFQQLNTTKFRQDIQLLGPSKFNLSPNSQQQALTGTVTTTKPRLLFMSIPYDEGWHATVDHKPVKTQKIVGNFIGLSIPKPGRHFVKLTYHVPGLKIGLAVSIVMAILAIGNEFYWRKVRKNQIKPLKNQAK